MEFTLTNRGLRFDRKFDAGWGDGGPTLALDCLECSERTGGVGMWVSIYLQEFGSRYVREQPHDLYYTPWRPHPSSGPPVDRLAYIAPTLPTYVAEDARPHPVVFIAYTKCLGDRVRRRQDPPAFPFNKELEYGEKGPGMVSWEALRRCGLDGAPRVAHDDLQESILAVDWFTSPGIRNPRFCHAFYLKLDEPSRVAGIVLGCGTLSANINGPGPGPLRFPGLHCCWTRRQPTAGTLFPPSTPTMSRLTVR